MAIKYYAIKKGRNSKTNSDVTNIIVNSWNECLSYVKGVKGAIYKSFSNEVEAKEYLTSQSSLKKGIDDYPADIPHIYVDGSYNAASEHYGYGLVVIKEGVITYIKNGGGCNKECNQRQVNGELRAAIEGIEYALNNNYKNVVVFYDYEGVCQHATGNWERNTTLSKEYYEKISTLKSEGDINIIFVKVDSHTDDLYNDIADELAKTGAGVTVDYVVDKAIKNDNLRVYSNEIKSFLSCIIIKNIDNVICANHMISKEDILDNESKDEKINNIIAYIKGLRSEDQMMYLHDLETDIKDEILVTLINTLI